ncbi:hypothetical protein BD779DRAFT_1513548 [Infundibulicybe gibba]|nr:hypothetical protein BD779DRAFT_1513548 [Infundibulicybe gibba]
MQSLRNRIPHLLRLRTSKTGTSSTVDQGSLTAPLFQRIPPWWARWTWGLIACDIFLTSSAIELTWNHWSTLVSDLERVSPKPADAPQNAWIPRPAWQRFGLCAAHLGLGAGCAAALLVAQLRFVRTLAVLPPAGKEGRQLFVQCAHNWRKNGTLFPLARCTLQEGRNETEMVLRVAGERGHWYVGLDDALVHGAPGSVTAGRDAILQAWANGGKRVGKWTKMAAGDRDSRWKSGPVSRQN